MRWFFGRKRRTGVQDHDGRAAGSGLSPGGFRFHRHHERVIKVVIERRLLWHRSIAAALSLALPGGGHVYRGRPLASMAWMAVVIAAYFAATSVGIGVHLACIAAAACGSNTKTLRRSFIAVPAPDRLESLYGTFAHVDRVSSS